MVPANAEEMITIQRYYAPIDDRPGPDVLFYPLKTGQELKWLNADNVVHRLDITLQNGTLVSNSGSIEPNSHYSYRFEQPGTYHFKSVDYPSIDGDVYVTDDIMTMTDSLGNSLDVQVSWTPAAPSAHKETWFKVIFINPETGRNQGNITQVFSVTDSKGNSAYPMQIFTPTGVQTGAYIFESKDEYTVKSSISYINFVPSEAEAKFSLVTTPEMSSVTAVMVISGIAISAIAALARIVRASKNGKLDS
ncbi:cupredoxin domain-containing protein [Nitrososphaera viennensis]|uniref:cupredoxin domain-containing protein n=1 Tax=Nitrososphaera viennensis TaxID=1034015 RepID=UPI0021B01D8E|nr:hypothetical protein [Nitrososphaera viennensis]